MSLHSATLGFAFVLLSAVLGVLLLAASALDRQRSLAWWGSAFCLTALGMSMVSLGQAHPVGATLRVADGTVALAYGAQYAGCRSFNGRGRMLPALLAGPLLLLAAWPFIHRSFDARFLVMTVIIVGASVAAALELWRAPPPRLRSQRLASLLLIACAAVHALRASLLGLDEMLPWAAPFAERWSAEVALMLLIYVPVLAFVFIWMSKERIEKGHRTAMEDLAVARLAAERASSAKTEFLASMSHEIRTQLNGVIGSAELLLDGNLTPEQHQHADRIRKSGSALLTVVNDILDFSKIEAGAVELDPEPFWPRALIAECVAITEEAAKRKNLALRFDTGDEWPPRVIGDEPRLRQVLLNLLNNAVKFTTEGSVTVSLSHDSISPTHERLRFAVADTGIGIPEDKLGAVFERFSQVDGSTTRRYGGTGLGLAISRHLVELMGGELGVDSRPAEGSTFWFTVTLPRATESEAARPELSGISRPRRQGVRLLLAEDVEINREIATAILERAGYAIDVVSDGAAAVRAVQEHAYDLVLMDVQMPVMDGIEATSRIRSLEGPVRHIPIVAMTANVYAEQVASFTSHGMNDHVGKPFRPDELCGVIERVLTSSDRGRVVAEADAP
jgi:signal transduction histidine kinase/CheY-like chemotaxis protein